MNWRLLVGSFGAFLVQLLAAYLVTACGNSLTSADAKNLTNARNLNGEAYQHVGPDTAPGAEIRGARCAVEKVMRDYGVPVPNDDAGITCKRGD